MMTKFSKAKLAKIQEKKTKSGLIGGLLTMLEGYEDS